MKLKAISAACALALMAAPVLAGGDQEEKAMSQGVETAEQLQEAQELLSEGIDVIRIMKDTPEVAAVLDQAKGVFVLPRYAAAALLVGGSGGEGVLMIHDAGDWGNPVFYDVGSASFGLQAGVEVGSVAMLLMNDRAVDSFRQENNFSLDAEAGLSIIDWSAHKEASLGKGDVVVYSATEGLFAEASLAVSDINFDEEENFAYYGQEATPDAILTGKIPNPHAQDLINALAQL